MGWQVIQAPTRGEPSGGNEMREYGQTQKLTQPDFYQKEQYKEEHADESMLPGQQMYYLSKQSDLDRQEQALRGQMYSYFSKSTNIPSSAMQSQWNSQLANIAQQRMLLKAEGGEFKQNYKIAEARRTKLIEGGDKSTANRLAMRNVNGTYLATLGPKEEGQGWLTQLEEVKGFDYAPGTKGGAPVDTDLSTSINYTGDWNKFVNDQFNEVSKSKSIVPGQTGMQTVSPLFGTDNVKYMSVLTQSDNSQKIIEAAGNMIEDAPESAKLDLATKFHEKLLHVGRTEDGNLAIRLDNNIHQLNFSKDESATLRKYLSAQKLDSQDIDRIGEMTKRYGQALILAKAPTKVETSEVLRDIKVVDKGTGEGVTPIGEFTLLSKGELQPSGNAEVAVRQHNAITPSSTEPLRQWNLSPRSVQDFNKDAKDMLINEGGIDPSYFSSGTPWFYSEDGIPNSMAILKDSGAAIVGLTGRVQENYKPVAKQGKKGYELDVPDVTNMLNYELKNSAIKTVEVNVAVPSKSDFYDYLSVRKGLDKTTGVSKSDYPQQDYYFPDAGGKKTSRDYLLVRIWVPVVDNELMKFENKGYEKGTFQAQEAQNKNQAQAVKNLIEGSFNEATIK